MSLACTNVVRLVGIVGLKQETSETSNWYWDRGRLHVGGAITATAHVPLASRVIRVPVDLHGGVGPIGVEETAIRPVDMQAVAGAGRLHGQVGP